ncbi:MAG: hypothetical protein ACO2PN_21510 [Pyrobaculum sp.]|jgi:hypothetical protein
MVPEKFLKDIARIYKILPYIDVRKDGDFRYTISNPGVWVAHTDGIVNTVKVGNQLILKDRILLNGKEAELCLRNGQCLSASGIKVRIGALILAYYSWLDRLPLSITRRKMLYYINNVEKDPELAEFAVWALAARNALFDEAIEIAIALVEEIRKLRLVAYMART